MSKRIFKIAPLFLAALLFAGLTTAHAADWPRPKGPVGDYAHVFSDKGVKTITNWSMEAFQKTGASLVVATVPSLGDQTIEELAVELFEKWGIGQKGKDDGVLFLLALKDRKARIEVGYGLEGIIPDATARRIYDQAMLPSLRKNKFDVGLAAGVAAAAQIIAKDKGVKLNGVPEFSISNTRQAKKRDGGGAAIWLFLLLFLFIGGIAGGVRHRRSGGSFMTGMLMGAIMSSSGRFGGFGGGGGGGFGGFGGGMSGGGGFSGDF